MVISALIPKLFSNKLKIAAGIFAAGSVVGSSLEIPPVTAYLELLAPSAVIGTEPPAETSASADVPQPETSVTPTPAPAPETPAVPEKAPETPYVTVSPEPAVQETPDWNWDWESVPTVPAEPVVPEVPEVSPEVPVYDEYPDWMEGLFVPADPLPAPEENDWMDTPAWKNSVPEDTQSSSMTEELAGMLENLAVFWSTADNKIHLDPACTSGTLFAGTVEEAQTVRADGWCRRCAEHLDGTSNEVFYIKGNAFAVTESLLECYSFSDYLRKIPSDAFGG